MGDLELLEPYRTNKKRAVIGTSVQTPTSKVCLPRITTRRRGFTLDIPSAEVQSGIILGIFGHSGSGKTSYARNLFETLGAENVVFLPQQDSLLEDVTAEQNTLLAADPDLTAHLLHDRVVQFADALDLSDRLKWFARRLSGGERRRTLLMRTFASKASILLLDEPFVGLGWRDELRAREFVRHQRSRFQLIIIISHSAELLWSLSDLIWVLNEGHKVAEIDPSKPDDGDAFTLAVADSLGVTNIITRSRLAELCMHPVTWAVPAPASELVAFWLADTLASDTPPLGMFRFAGCINGAVQDVHRYCVRGRRILEVRTALGRAEPLFLQDETSGANASFWLGIRAIREIVL